MSSKGYKHTAQAIEKIRQASLLRKNPEKYTQFTCKSCSKTVIDFKSNKRSGFCSLKCYWEGKKGSSHPALKGKPRSLDVRLKISESRKGKTAKENHPNWKGGVSAENHLLRSTFVYKEWRKKVFQRDGWSCVFCGHRSVKRNDIEADHIKRFSDFPELRHEVSNGRTLCVPCHRKVTFGKI